MDTNKFSKINVLITEPKNYSAKALDIYRKMDSVFKLDEKKDSSHLKKDSLWKYAKNNKNLLITSHLGGVSYEAMAATEDFIAGLVFSYTQI